MRFVPRFILLAIALVVFQIAVGPPWQASAAPFAVTNLNDAGVGSLRAAIISANGSAGLDTISFAAGLTGTITLTTGQLNITDAVQITGPGANLISVSGNNASRVFNIANTAGGTSISGLTVTGGFNASNAGGIQIVAATTLQDMAFVGNNVGNPACFCGGGGVYVGSAVTVTLNNVLVSNNTVQGGSQGAGISAAFGGTLNLNNVTIDGNQLPGNPGVGSEGAGLYVQGATANLNNVTITNNTIVQTSGGGGGLKVASATNVNIHNSLIAGNTSGTGPDCNVAGSGTLTSQGYNLIGNSTGCILSGTTTGNKLNVAPNIGPLANNGGPTQTRAVLPGSPAIDAGDPAGCVNQAAAPLTTDQRGAGFPRSIDGDGNGTAVCDIGAFESQTVPTLPSLAKSFNPASVVTGATTTLTFTIANPGAIALTGVAFSDTLPSGVVVATPPALTNTCGGAPSAVAGAGVVSLTNGSVAAAGSCSISVQVLATTTGTKVNQTTTLTSNEVAAAGIATATLNVSTTPSTPTPTATPVASIPVVIPVIPQVFQNPGGAVAIMGNRPQATPRPGVANQPAAVPAVANLVIQPPNTGDAGLAQP